MLLLRFKSYAIVALSAALVATALTWRISAWHSDAQKLAALQTQRDQFSAQRALDNELLLSVGTEKVKVRTVYRTIREEVERVPTPTSNECAAPAADIERLWNAASQAASQSAAH